MVADPHGHQGAAVPPHVARLELDELLPQLVERAQDVMATRDRLRGLLEATRSISTDLDLPVLLRRITQAACDLVGARYGALGVIGPRGDLVEFITVGVDEGTAAALGPPPHGAGLLGALVRTPHPLRLDDLRDHPDSVGLPPGHPPMASFLGVPVRVRDQVFGNLYLTEKLAEPSVFSAEDEELLVALASAAGVAVDGARLLDAAQRRQRWLQAAADVVRDLLGAEAPDLDGAARRAREAAGADAAAVLLVDPDDEQLLRVAGVDGAGSHVRRGTRVDLATSLPGRAVLQGRDLVLPTTRDPGPLDAVPGLTGGPALLVRIPTPGPSGSGVVALRRRVGGAPFDEQDRAMAADFAGHVGLAIEHGRALQLRRRLVVLDERDRIARDLHDHVVQQVFAAGLRMSALAARTGEARTAAALRELVDDGDETIRTIRSTIFQLRQDDAADLRAELQRIGDEFAEVLGFAPAVRFEGPLDGGVEDQVAENARAVVREALSNVARHAHASSAQVRVALSDDDLVVTVQDDGTGISGTGPRSGLDNLAARAEDLAGSLTVVSPPGPGGRGTLVRWRVPRQGG